MPVLEGGVRGTEELEDGFSENIVKSVNSGIVELYKICNVFLPVNQ